jgi:hypothetical protein
MARPAKMRRAARDLSLLIPTREEESAPREAPSMEEVELDIAKAVGEMAILAREHNKDVPRMNMKEFSVSVPTEGVVVVQSKGNLYAFNTDTGKLSIYGKKGKFVVG